MGYVEPRRGSDCEEILSSEAFLSDLAGLDGAIIAALEAAGEPAVINGNVLYANKVENFQKAAFSAEMAAKRRALVAMAQRARVFVEVGVAGGHAVLLALHANPDLRVVGIDLARRLRPFWPPVEVFVPAAAAWLEARFPDRFRLIVADALDGLREVAQTRPFGLVDMVHLDGGKAGRLEELAALWPAIAPRAWLMQGDYAHGLVREATREMLARGLARDPSDGVFAEARDKRFRVLETGPAIAAECPDLADFDGKRVLFCTAHQDDEVLFAGGLLAEIAPRADVTVACFFRPAEGRADTMTRTAAMARVCAALGVSHVQYPFAIEGGPRALRRFISLPSEPEELRARPRRALARHPLFPVLCTTAEGAMRLYTPDIVITHNEAGEYGHREHVLLHHAVRAAAARAGVRTLLTFGEGMAGTGLTVTPDPEAKRTLFAPYLPQWDGVARYDFALGPERFLRVPLLPVTAS
ncbi:PIG-L family deacetylase [Roseovarius autotrophicus]|uniref:PIG-L family deacetylase n=1 Tax=Roseovarius autotrophicus TaxID=2824121 RepID=UPI0019F4CCD9|nr:PIG-L family deacetylase [Roseovarius autotrophicus]MBE0452377.1 PIG-L family deacetylase [Roseovarius sp.]